MRIAHLSDLHFGHHDEELAASLSADISSQNPDLVVVSGDFTQIGSRAEFQAASEFLDSLSVPHMAVPGNHDVPMYNLVRRFTDPYAYYREYINSELEPLIVADGVALAGIKTSRRFRWGFNWSNGSISRDQLEDLERRFDSVKSDAVRVVVAHHPLLHPDEMMEKPQKLVKRADRALKTFADLGVKLVLSGHFHMSYLRRYGQPGEVAVNDPQGPRESREGDILVAQTSSTISTRLRGHSNAYNLIDIENGEITIRVREWLEQTWSTREEAMTAV